MASYVEIDHSDISNPVDEGLYERSGANYVLTADTVVVAWKTYYMYDDYDAEDEGEEYFLVDVVVGDPVVGYYEYDGEDYTLTQDTVAVSGKEYYEYFDGDDYEKPFDLDSLYYPIANEVDNPSASGLYEKNSEGLYVLTEDTEYVEDKIYYNAVEPAEKIPVETLVSGPIYDPANTVFDGIPEAVTAYSDASSTNFIYAYTAFVDDPSAKGFYEIQDGYYVLTQDTSIVKGKAYYEFRMYSDYYPVDMSGVNNPALALIRYYEISQNHYVLTSDTAVIPGKTYYRSRTDDKTPYLNDPSRGQEPATYDQIPIES